MQRAVLVVIWDARTPLGGIGDTKAANAHFFNQHIPGHTFISSSFSVDFVV